MYDNIRKEVWKMLGNNKTSALGLTPEVKEEVLEISEEVAQLLKDVINKVLDVFEDQEISTRLVNLQINRVGKQLAGFEKLGLSKDQALAIILKGDREIELALKTLGGK